jgi:excisionase family DNA binding protein
MGGKGINLKPAEIAAALDTEDLRRRFPPVLTVPQLAELLQRSRKTIYCWIEKGRLDGAFRKRGKGHLLWRDRVLDRVFNGPEWESDDDE